MAPTPLVLAWYRRARIAQLAHSAASNRARRASVWLGVPAAILGIVAGSASVADLGVPKAVVAISSFGAATLVSLQTFLRLDDSSAQHRTASRGFGRIRRALGQLGASPAFTEEEVQARLDQIRMDYDAISTEGPQVPDRLWKGQVEKSASYWPEEFGQNPASSASAPSGGG